MTQQQPVSMLQLRDAASDPLFLTHFERYVREKEDDAQRRFKALDLHDVAQRYAVYRQMRDEFKEEDHYYESTYTLPAGDDPEYRKYKLQCVRTPGYRMHQ
jgi:hypothetical protein